MAKYNPLQDERGTPRDLFDALNTEFKFYLDACASAENRKCAWYLTKTQNGLNVDWCKFGTTFVNPPFGPGGTYLKLWARKAFEQSQSGIVVVCLLPAKTDTGWFHDWCMRAAEIRFIRGRLTYEAGELAYKDENGPANFPSMIVIFHPMHNGSSEPEIKSVGRNGAL